MPLPQCQPPEHQHCPGSDNYASPIASQSCLHLFSWHFSALLLSRKTTATLLLSKEATWINRFNGPYGSDCQVHRHHKHLNISSLGGILTQQQMWSKVGWRMAFLQFLPSDPAQSPSNHLIWSPGRGQCSPHHKRNLHLEDQSFCSKADKNQESLQSRFKCKVGVCWGQLL